MRGWSERNFFLDGLSDEVVSRPEAANQTRFFVERVAWRRDANSDFDAGALVREARVVTLAVLAFPEPLPTSPMKVGQRRGGAVIPRSFPLPPFPNPTCAFRYASGSPLVLVAKPGVFIQPIWKGCTRRRAM